MPTNSGFFNEDEILASLEGKRVKDLTNNMRRLLQALFGVLDADEVVHARKTEDFVKPDLIITYKGKERFLSIKFGRAEAVHEEIVENFVDYLGSLGISKETRDTILLYHFGDGTTDGSGDYRIEYNALRVKLDGALERANIELNRNKEIVRKILDRCLWNGSKNSPVIADSIYHGDAEYGLVVTRRQIDRYLEVKNWNWMKNLHIGPLQLRPHARYVGKVVRSEKRRHALICYWANFVPDLNYIAKNYNY